jgi:uracil-DNA glycosylase
VIVALGKIGFDSLSQPFETPRPDHNQSSIHFWTRRQLQNAETVRTLLASYHPSNQNTQTGKLTRPMFVDIFRKARRLAG